jgi:hypothetical protein
MARRQGRNREKYAGSRDMSMGISGRHIGEYTDIQVYKLDLAYNIRNRDKNIQLQGIQIAIDFTVVV